MVGYHVELHSSLVLWCTLSDCVGSRMRWWCRAPWGGLLKGLSAALTDMLSASHFSPTQGPDLADLNVISSLSRSISPICQGSQVSAPSPDRNLLLQTWRACCLAPPDPQHVRIRVENDSFQLRAGSDEDMYRMP